MSDKRMMLIDGKMRYTSLTELADENSKLRARQAVLVEALTELVRLKDMKEVAEITISEQDRGALLHFYEIDKPKAWAAARAALAQGEG